MSILVTGTAGFIGFFVAKTLLSKGHEVIGIDNHNSYYDPQLKEDRVKQLLEQNHYTHLRVDISNKDEIKSIFNECKPKKVVHLAAQAGVRFSIENPYNYIDSNISGFLNILEGCRHNNIEHLVYASSSSVYGANTKMPFATNQNVDHPLSLYAATKKSNELMAHSYSHLYGIPTSGLRFFTVYGPWGRPDMALFKFTKAILANKPIELYNYGKHTRDFTYIDDIVEGITRVLDNPPDINKSWDTNNPDPGTSNSCWCIYNIGNNNPVELLDYVDALEKALEKETEKILLPLQMGDVPDTYADINDLVTRVGYKPSTSVYEGIGKFVNWYLKYYQI